MKKIGFLLTIIVTFSIFSIIKVESASIIGTKTIVKIAQPVSTEYYTFLNNLNTNLTQLKNEDPKKYTDFLVGLQNIVNDFASRGSTLTTKSVTNNQTLTLSSTAEKILIAGINNFLIKSKGSQLYNKFLSTMKDFILSFQGQTSNMKVMKLGSGDTNATILVTGIQLQPTTTNITLSGNIQPIIQFTATILPATATNKNIVWSLSGNSAIFINENTSGDLSTKKVKIIGCGLSTLTAKTEDGGFTKTGSIIGNTIATGMIVSGNKIHFYGEGTTGKFTPIFYPTCATGNVSRSVSCNNPAEGSGTISANGIFTVTKTKHRQIINDTTRCDIKATYNNLQKTGRVYLHPIVITGVTLRGNNTDGTMNLTGLGDSATFTIDVLPRSASGYFACEDFVWQPSSYFGGNGPCTIKIPNNHNENSAWFSVYVALYNVPSNPGFAILSNSVQVNYKKGYPVTETIWPMTHTMALPLGYEREVRGYVNPPEANINQVMISSTNTGIINNTTGTRTVQTTNNWNGTQYQTINAVIKSPTGTVGQTTDISLKALNRPPYFSSVTSSNNSHVSITPTYIPITAISMPITTTIHSTVLSQFSRMLLNNGIEITFSPTNSSNKMLEWELGYDYRTLSSTGAFIPQHGNGAVTGTNTTQRLINAVSKIKMPTFKMYENNLMEMTSDGVRARKNAYGKVKLYARDPNNKSIVASGYLIMLP